MTTPTNPDPTHPPTLTGLSDRLADLILDAPGFVLRIDRQTTRHLLGTYLVTLLPGIAEGRMGVRDVAECTAQFAWSLLINRRWLLAEDEGASSSELARIARDELNALRAALTAAMLTYGLYDSPNPPAA